MVPDLAGRIPVPSPSVDDEQQQFTVVRKGRKRSERQARPCLGGAEGVSSSDLVEVSRRKIDRIMVNVCDNVELIKYSQHIISLLLKSLFGRKLSTIWALGLGSFSRSYYPGCNQLALLLKLKECFGCKVYFQEPCLTKEEKQWLCDHGICLSESTDLVKCRFSDNRDENVVLFYAPHCGHAMYNSVIYAHRKKLKRIVFIGNNFHTMDLSSYFLTSHSENLGASVANPRKHAATEQCLTKSGNPKFDELQALSAYTSVCSAIEFPIFKSNFAAFNDTAVHFLAGDVVVPEILDRKPVYQRFRHEIVI